MEKLKDIKHKLLVFVLVALLFYILQNVAFAVASGEPNLFLTINKDGSIVTSGNMFNELFYPGHKGTGIIRIINDYANITVSELAIKVNLSKFKEEYSKDLVYNSFLDHMRLTVKKGTLLIFDKTLVTDKSLRDFLYIEGDASYNGLDLSTEDQFIIYKNQAIDLKYDLSMAMEAGNELESVSASLKLLLNVTTLPSSEGRMTGGGSVIKDGERVTHGFTLHDDIEAASNNLEINWAKNDKFHLDKLLNIDIANNKGVYTLQGTGTGKFNGIKGANVEFKFTDAGEPGNKDYIEVVVKDVYGKIVLSTLGNLKQGNHQAQIK